MKNKSLFRIVLAGAVLVAANVSPLLADSIIFLPTPSVGVTVNGLTVSTSGLVRSFDPETNQTRLVGDISTNDWALHIDTTTETDPFALYAIGASNFTAGPLSFAFIFTTPVALGPYNHVSNSFNGSMTDLRGDGVAITNVDQQALLNGSNVAPVELGVFTCLGGPGLAGQSYNCPIAGGGFGPISTSVPNALYSTLSASLAFTLSANDAASFNGVVILDSASTPEPASMGLALAGVALIFAGIAKRRKA